MPSTIKNHAIDFNNDNHIDLKNTKDSFASAANYLNNMGWKKTLHVLLRLSLKTIYQKNT